MWTSLWGLGFKTWTELIWLSFLSFKSLWIKCQMTNCKCEWLTLHLAWSTQALRPILINYRCVAILEVDFGILWSVSSVKEGSGDVTCTVLSHQTHRIIRFLCWFNVVKTKQKSILPWSYKHILSHHGQTLPLIMWLCFKTLWETPEVFM